MGIMKGVLKVLGGSAGITVGACVGYQFPYLIQAKKKLDMEFDKPQIMVNGFNIFPIINAAASFIPHPILNMASVKNLAPSPDKVPADYFDMFGENPYRIQEIKPGKVWAVTHDGRNFLHSTEEGRMGLKLMGVDFLSEETKQKILAEAAKEGKQELAKKDLETAERIHKIPEKELTKEDIKACGAWSQNMMIVKLNNGGVLLYCPVRIHPDMEELIQRIGPVEWIILGSSAHNNHPPSVIRKYPHARVIGATTSEAKLNAVNALPREKLDYNVCIEGDTDKANELLNEDGVKIQYIKGEVCTDAIVAIAHKVAISVDLIYGKVDGTLLMMDKDEMENPKDELWATRLFRWGLITNGPNGYLPAYRFWAMDPTVTGPLMMTPPAADGSSCQEMATSLRKVLQEDFDTGVSVHFNPISGDVYRRSMDACWGWLDKKSLLDID